jgi:hypothetical protein
MPLESPDEKRAARPLGRGLEEISHLFLSHPATASAGGQGGDSPTHRTPVPPETQTVPAVLRPGAPLTTAQVTAALRGCRSAFGDDMAVVAAGIVCSPYGEIDLLALDHTHQLTIIDVQTTIGDGLLARGLSHVDWVVRNIATVQRLHPDWIIDVSRQPRLALVAPRFSLALRSGVRQLTGPSVSCFRYCTVELLGVAGIFVERV